MPRQFTQALHYGKDWLTSTAGVPIRAAYDFLFPPLDLLDHVNTPDTMEWRATNPRSYRGSGSGSGVGNTASSSANFHPDEAIDHLDLWDSFSDSPWSFIGSRYTMALIIVAIVNNRVQHICRPRRGGSGGTTRLSQLQRIALRLPSLILLSRSVLIFLTIVADAFLSESNPINALLRYCTTASWRNAWLAHTPMSGWAQIRFGSSSRDALIRSRDAFALWAAFTSTCVAVISDAVVRNLDADRDEPSSFNLVGFAFLLHFHSFAPDAPANEHVYLCVLLQILQILIISLSRYTRPVLVPRLVISSFFGVSMLLHYGLAANSGRYPFLEAMSRTPEIALVLIVLLTITLHALTMLLLEGKIQPHRLLFSRANLPSLDEDWTLALFKLGTACMESTRLTGLEREVEPLIAWEAPYIELSSSGGIELVDPHLSRSSASRLSTHTSSTSLHPQSEPHGFSREIKEIRIEPNATSQSGNSSSNFGHAGFARVRAFLQFCVVTLLVVRNVAMMALRKVLRMVGLPDPSVPRWVYKVLKLVRLAWHGRNGEARRRERQALEAERQRREQEETRERMERYQREQQRYAVEEQQQQQQGARSAEGGSSLGFSRMRRSEASSAGADGLRTATGAGRAGSSLLAQLQELDSVLSRRSMAAPGGDVDSDEEDQDFDHLRAEREIRYDSEDDEDDGPESADELHIEADEVSGLLEELNSFVEDDSTTAASSQQVTLRSGTEPFNRLLLAHLTHSPTQPPLTRSAYTSLLQPRTSSTSFDTADLHLAQTILNRRHSQPPPTTFSDDTTRRLCVVCCTEERNVICWPCRCLCLCMDCREHLASRPPRQNTFIDRSTSLTPNTPPPNPTHLCPTCRSPVLAFSRLYIP